MSLDLDGALTFGFVEGRDQRTRSCKNCMQEVWRPNALPGWLSNVLSKIVVAHLNPETCMCGGWQKLPWQSKASNDSNHGRPVEPLSILTAD